MPVITTTAGRANIGRDIQINLIGGAGGNATTTGAGNGRVTTINNIVSFSYRQETIDIMRTTITSATIVADIPRLWSGTIEFIRAGDDVDTLIDDIENDWFTTGIYTNGHMEVTVTDPGGGNYQMRFLDVALKMEEGGTYKGDDLVNVRLGWRAAQRIGN